MKFRVKSGELSGFVLDSLRGLSEILQYGQGEQCMEQMNKKTEALSKDEEGMKCIASRNTAVTNTVILIFDLSMLFCRHCVTFRCADFTLALIFRPVWLLRSGSTLQQTLLPATAGYSG